MGIHYNTSTLYNKTLLHHKTTLCNNTSTTKPLLYTPQIAGAGCVPWRAQSGGSEVGVSTTMTPLYAKSRLYNKTLLSSTTKLPCAMTFRLPELDTSLGEPIWVSTTVRVPSTTKLSFTTKLPSAIKPLQQNSPAL